MTVHSHKAVAKLIGCSSKNNNKPSYVIKQAKAYLGITSKARKLPSETNQKIYSHIVEIYSQVNNFDNIRVAFYTIVNGDRKR